MPLMEALIVKGGLAIWHAGPAIAAKTALWISGHGLLAGLGLCAIVGGITWSGECLELLYDASKAISNGNKKKAAQKVVLLLLKANHVTPDCIPDIIHNSEILEKICGEKIHEVASIIEKAEDEILECAKNMKK